MRVWKGGLSVALLVALLAVGGCQPTNQDELVFKGMEFGQDKFGGPLELTDYNSVKRSLKDFRGKWVVLFFGYTHCPDVCPTTLGDTAAALRLMTPEQAKQIQVIFVSVDPERDSLPMLRDYVTYFDPGFLAMTGSEVELTKVAADFRIIYRRQVTSGVSGYLIDHTAGSYLLDPKGRPRLLFPYGMPAADMAHDLRLLIPNH